MWSVNETPTIEPGLIILTSTETKTDVLHSEKSDHSDISIAFGGEEIPLKIWV
jgi:hypothetical protein